MRIAICNKLLLLYMLDTVHQLEKKYGMVENEVGYKSTIAYSNLYGFCENPNNNITHGSGYEPHGLRLD
ncbi:hypothetical protein Hanom_Chr17g01577191 [Helianthus anomalus]